MRPPCIRLRALHSSPSGKVACCSADWPSPVFPEVSLPYHWHSKAFKNKLSFSSQLFGLIFSFILEIWSYLPLPTFPPSCFHIPHEESLGVVELCEIMCGIVCIHLMRSLENKDIWNCFGLFRSSLLNTSRDSGREFHMWRDRIFPTFSEFSIFKYDYNSAFSTFPFLVIKMKRG